MTEQVGGRREAGEASVQSSYVSEPADRGHGDAKRHVRSRGVFVTGTGTGVGKTVVAAAIARTLAAAGQRVAVFKPAVTGLDELADAAGPAAGPPPHIAGREAARRPDHEALRVAARVAAE